MGDILLSFQQLPDMETALSHYWKVSNMRVVSNWMQHFVAQASFNLAFMYQFGKGIGKDLKLARRLYQRCKELDPSTDVKTPINIVLALLSAHEAYDSMSPKEVIFAKMRRDMRVHVL